MVSTLLLCAAQVLEYGLPAIKWIDEKVPQIRQAYDALVKYSDHWWEGPSPFEPLCVGQIEYQTKIGFLGMFFQARCVEVDVTLMRKGIIPTVNLLKLSGLRFEADIDYRPATLNVDLIADFYLGTGASDCTAKDDPACLKAVVSAGVRMYLTGIDVRFSLLTSGAWLEPLGLRNFGIIDPSCGMMLTLITVAPFVAPKGVWWSGTILYKVTSDAWPAALTAPGAAWPPDLKAHENELRYISSHFLFEMWSPVIDDLLCRVAKLPRFAFKLIIPRLSLMDVMRMFADLGMSLYAGMSGDAGAGTPPAAASLMEAVDELLRIDMSVEAELSTIHHPDGVPEWGTTPVQRGIYLNASLSAAAIAGFSFNIRVFCESGGIERAEYVHHTHSPQPYPD